MKNDATFVRMRSGDHRGDAKSDALFQNFGHSPSLPPSPLSLSLPLSFSLSLSLSLSPSL